MEEGKKSETLPPGFRFHPTDEELVTYYLANKISDSKFTGRAVADVDLNKCEPWDLPAKAKMGEKEWYFFSLRDRKYPTGVRTNRATNAGYWKTTGKDKEIFSSTGGTATSSPELVGMKKTLVFYKGRAPRGEKTNWVIHEYRLLPKPSSRNHKDGWVICRVFQKSSGGKKCPSSAQLRPNHYSLDMVHRIVVPPPSMIQADPYHLAGVAGRGYMGGNVDLAELTRVLRGNQGITLPMMQQQTQQQPQMSFSGGGGFAFSGLNLNLGVPVQQQQHVRPMAPPQQIIVEAHQPVLNDCGGGGDLGFGGEIMNNPHGGNRFQGMEGCMDLEGYWPSY